MNPILRLFGVFVVFCFASFGWLTLGGITQSRSNTQLYSTRGLVTELWGQPQVQQAPLLNFSWVTPRTVTHTKTENGRSAEISEVVWDTHDKAVAFSGTDMKVDLSLDQRRKGLVWYALYDIQVDGTWTYTHEAAEAGTLTYSFTFPDQQGIYEGFRLIVDGVDHASEVSPQNGVVQFAMPVHPGQTVQFQTAYGSRGLDEWLYQPANGVANLEKFRLAMNTDFDAIDFPSQTMSPSSKARQGEGWELMWDFDQVVTGHGVGMVMPQRIQPGQLATELSFSAPVSLMFFFLVVFVLSVLRGIDMHPINYLFVAGAFFAFHLLFAYTVDHLEVEKAFALSSVVSVFLVISYLRLVVGARFAFVEAGLAQLLYLVGFSMAHFWEGLTGLTITVLSIVTLFALMQLTGRVKWNEVLSGKLPQPEPAPQV